MLCFNENSPSSIFLLGLASVSWLAPSRLKATPLTLASVSLRFCVSEFCVRVISKKHCKLELRGGEAWNDEVALLVECLCWHGWLLLIVQFMTVDLRWHGWCWTRWFSIYDSWFMLARLVLNAVVFQLNQSDLQTKTGAYSLVLTHSREFVCVLPLDLLCLFFCFLFPPCFTRHHLLLAIFGLRPVVQPSGA